MAKDDISQLLQSAQIIAIVGLSADPSKPSFGVAQALRHFGYQIVPVSPTLTEWQGIPAFPTLKAAVESTAPNTIDIVNVFRRPEFVDGIVSDCIELRLPALWLQLGVIDHAAAERARAAGMTVVMDKCIKVERAKMA